jgi:hypothetical protein
MLFLKIDLNETKQITNCTTAVYGYNYCTQKPGAIVLDFLLELTETL